ncbi:terpene synthase [Micromonospora sp. C31]|uniref:terpene synthase family protein n=1 Tax=Micromonospora sp. C31 TaxID=2824876 RepID=UPI001B39BC5B|nr:terpene synthase family protein [Micromonospora sp. C31]MBQ1073418.1 terpene synthase [Micromonospora sp. C31]
MSATDARSRAGLVDVAEQGRICALATRGVRDLQEVVAAHPGLFSATPFDPAMLSSVATAIAFTAPWHSADELRITTRTLLWVFAADWQVDHLAASAEDVRAVVAECLAVADGAAPPAGRHLARLLADIRDELARVPAFGGLRPVWRDELARMLAAVAREWDWKNAAAAPGGSLPTLDRYLDNADNLACSFVNVTHWLATGDGNCLRHLDELLTVGREVQRVLRLVNDLATHERDVEWGDLNALMLVADPALVRARLTGLTQRCHGLLDLLAGRDPRQADYMRRQISFTAGFYQVSDFWGTR